MNQLLSGLRFYATDTFGRVVGDLAGISESSECQIVKRVSRALARLAPNEIKMPQTEDERQQTKQEIETIARFPNALGMIDCTHIRIKSPGMLGYLNTKGRFVIT